MRQGPGTDGYRVGNEDDEKRFHFLLASTPHGQAKSCSLFCQIGHLRHRGARLGMDSTDGTDGTDDGWGRVFSPSPFLLVALSDATTAGIQRVSRNLSLQVDLALLLHEPRLWVYSLRAL